MKTGIYLFILLLPTVMLAQDELGVETNWDGKRCNGSVGLCYVMPDPTGNANIISDGENVTFIIYRDKISESEAAQILGKPLSEAGATDTYILEEPFALDTDITIPLNLSTGTQIPTGEYPVIITSETVEIKFNIKEQ